MKFTVGALVGASNLHETEQGEGLENPTAHI